MSSFSLFAFRVVSSAYLRLLTYLLAILIPTYELSSPALCMMYYAYKLNKQGDNIQPCLYSFPNLEPVSYSLSGSNCCFLIHIQVFQETSKVVWHSYLFLSTFQFVVIHRVKGFSIVNETEVDVFLEFLCFLYDPADVGNLISGSSFFSEPRLDIWKFSVHIILKPSLEDF